MIVESAYAKKLVKTTNNKTENRKFLPSDTKIPFTEIITDNFAAFVSPRWDNFLFVTQKMTLSFKVENLCLI
ncbi:MAG: hypothetical protein R3B65_01665 [Candidatus Paceibacterota bacterium]